MTQHVEGHIVIRRPVDEVFDFVADERNEPRFNPRMVRVELLTPGPIGVGTRFAAEMRSGRRTAAMTIECTAHDPPALLGSSTRMATMDIDGALTFRPVPEGTRMEWSWDLEPRGALRFAGPLIGWIGRRQERQIWTNLKRLLEETA